jgi:hypothetical protein
MNLLHNSIANDKVSQYVVNVIINKINLFIVFFYSDYIIAF